MEASGSRVGRAITRRVLRVAVRVREAIGARPPKADAGGRRFGVLFVCLGNICRSPLAEGIFRSKLAALGLLGSVEVDSAGTSGSNSGRPPDDRARLVAQRHGIAIGDLRARTLVVDDFRQFDRIVAFDGENREAALTLAPDAEARSRIVLLRGDHGEVADPVAGSLRDFEHAFQVIAEGCDALLEDVRSRLGP